MQDFLKKHVTQAAYETWLVSNNYITPNVSTIENQHNVYYNHNTSNNDNAKSYFTIQNIDTKSGTISYSTDNTPEVYYSLNNGNWVSWIAETSITLNQNDNIRIKCNAEWNYTEGYIDGSGSPDDWLTGLSVGSGTLSPFNITFNFEVHGNIMSLLYGDNFENQTDISEIPMVFMGLFRDCSTLISAENLVLPAMTLSGSCYYYMFDGCTNLTEAPQLPATTLADNCYYEMFGYCTSLTTAPELPATTLADNCYYYMFDGCTSLNYIKCLATDISATNCTEDWLTNVAATGTFVKALSMESWTTGTSGIPSGWTVQNI